MQREFRFHSDEQIEDAVSYAADVVERLDLDGDLRVAAFVKVLELRTAKHVQVEQAMPLPGGMVIPRGG